MKIVRKPNAWLHRHIVHVYTALPPKRVLAAFAREIIPKRPLRLSSSVGDTSPSLPYQGPAIGPRYTIEWLWYDRFTSSRERPLQILVDVNVMAEAPGSHIVLGVRQGVVNRFMARGLQAMALGLAAWFAIGFGGRPRPGWAIGLLAVFVFSYGMDVFSSSRHCIFATDNLLLSLEREEEAAGIPKGDVVR